MKVIKHGNTVKEFTCPKCGCIFQAVNADIRAVSHEEQWYEYGSPSTTGTPYFAQRGQKLCSRCYVDRFIPCPECGADCREEAQNDGNGNGDGDAHKDDT